MRYVHVIGDSHSSCIWQAYKLAGRAGNNSGCTVTMHSLGGGAVAHDLMMVDVRGKRVLNPLLRSGLIAANAQLQKTENCVTAISAGGYITSVYTWDSQVSNFTFASEQVTHAIQTATVIPIDLVRDSLWEHFDVLVEALARASDVCKAPLIYLCSPPPYESNEEIVRRMSVQRSVAVDKVPQPLASETRLQVWTLAREILRERLSRLPIIFMDAPETTTTNDGYLESNFLGDGFHANVEYGKLLLKNIVSQPVRRMTT